jgi:peptide deformylase
MINNKFVQFDGDDRQILYTKCKHVDDISSTNIQNIIKEMYTEMHGVGLGLAANQLGYPYQIFMIEFDKEKSSRYSLDFDSVEYQVFINPRVISHSDKRVSFWHGCLSALGYKRAKLASYKTLEYSAYNEHSELITGTLDGLAAVVFQHEYAHLLGKMYVDYDTEYLDHDVLNEKVEAGGITLYEHCDESVPLIVDDFGI